jgi:hypothetical protein
MAVSARLRALAEDEMRRRRVLELENVVPDIPDDMTFPEWCDELARNGMLVDGKPFSLDNRSAMRWIYEQIPTTAAEAAKKQLAIMKCAQVGFTVLEMLAMLYMALKFKPLKVGMYLPNMKLASIKSADRFMPITRTVPVAYNLVVASSGKAGGEGNVLVRNMGQSRFYFLWTSGASMTESIPLDVVSFDEVQEMSVGDMEKTRERMSASDIRYTLMGSTANWEDSDIHFWYKKGSQHQFHTECPSCGQSSILDEHFPTCIDFDSELNDYRYKCVHCGGWIDDSQKGKWIAAVPDATTTSVHFPQLLSPTISPREIIEAYYNAEDMKNFYNRKLGKPYTDPSQVPINLDMLNQCADEGVRLGVVWKKMGKDMFMAIDQMGAFNVALIAERLDSGHMAIVHAEEIYDDDPFARCDELMDSFGISVCVLEQLPNFNDAHRFAKRHEGRVFLVNYRDMPDEWIRWGDAVPSKGERKTSDEDRVRYTVTIDQYRAMQMAFSKIQKKVCVFPDPMGLVQEVRDKAKRTIVPILKDRVFLHFTRTALIAEKDSEQNKYRRRVVKVGLDPHFSYAFMMLNVAWARAHGTSSFIMPESKQAAPVIENLHGLPDSVAAVMKSQEQERDVCGQCSAYVSETGRCSERNVLVRENDIACAFFM